jgi:hypothetical protein
MRIFKFTAVFCLVLLFAVLTETQSAGKCGIPAIETAYKNSKAVFVGEVLGIAKEGDVKTFTFKVEKYWKGVSGRQIEISVQETTRYQAWFEVGGKYLVFARGNEGDGKFWEVRCSRSKRLEDASEDIKKLGRAKKPAKK